jgi:hypothetical protein
LVPNKVDIIQATTAMDAASSSPGITEMGSSTKMRRRK